MATFIIVVQITIMIYIILIWRDERQKRRKLENIILLAQSGGQGLNRTADEIRKARRKPRLLK